MKTQGGMEMEMALRGWNNGIMTLNPLHGALYSVSHHVRLLEVSLRWSQVRGQGREDHRGGE